MIRKCFCIIRFKLPVCGIRFQLVERFILLLFNDIYKCLLEEIHQLCISENVVPLNGDFRLKSLQALFFFFFPFVLVLPKTLFGLVLNLLMDFFPNFLSRAFTLFIFQIESWFEGFDEK